MTLDLSEIIVTGAVEGAGVGWAVGFSALAVTYFLVWTLEGVSV